MSKVKKIAIYSRLEEKERLIGQLVLDDREILFKYSDDYLIDGYNLSPLMLRLDNSVQVGPQKPFNGLFGVFADALPDAWGRLLMRRRLGAKGIAIESLDVLDYLSYVGENGSGALVYKPINETASTEDRALDLDFLEKGVTKIMEGESSDVIDEMFGKGGSPGGARPKIYAGYNSTSNTLTYGQAELPEGFEHWIIKFAAIVDQPDIANIEMAYYKMALDAGIEMMESKLFVGKSGKQYFGTKRFDRIGNKRFHMISAAGMFHDDFEHSQMDYGTLLQEGQQLINDAQVTEQIFRRAVFNVLAHNRDDHSKNFAFLMDAKGKWKFAPAYDLTFSTSSQGMHSTTVARNGINPGSSELMSLANHFSVKRGALIIDEIKAIVNQWKNYAKEQGVSNMSMQTIEQTLKTIH